MSKNTQYYGNIAKKFIVKPSGARKFIEKFDDEYRELQSLKLDICCLSHENERTHFDTIETKVECIKKHLGDTFEEKMKYMKKFPMISQMPIDSIKTDEEFVQYIENLRLIAETINQE
jgi:hypothetical protein